MNSTIGSPGQNRFLHTCIFTHNRFLIGILLMLAASSLFAQTNVAPQITGQVPLETPQDTPIEIVFNYLQVTDPDDIYPDNFTMLLDAGTNYTLSGTNVIPDAGFAGTLTVPVAVNDGEASSQPFDLLITVAAANKTPVITGQTSLSTMEDQPITISFNDLVVEDPDDSYPTGFTMTLQPGSNYTISGQTITPDAGFTGTLSVPVTVNDGKNESDPFTLSITVNEQVPVNSKPVITGQVVLSTEEGTPITVQFSDLTVTDADDPYPAGFTMTLTAGSDYTIAGQTVTPDAGFTGTLTVPATVNDGEESSDVFNLSITVTASTPVNTKPVITGQKELTTEEDKKITLKFDDLFVTDPDNDYPADFTLTIGSGANYTVDSHTIIPAAGFSGTLTVPVSVNDGTDASDTFSLVITVTPKQTPNVKPTIIGQAALSMLNNETLTIQFNHLIVSDPDNTYPSGFRLTVYNGSNYSVSGTTITPNSNFTGILTVKVSVNDGQAESDKFDLKVTVNESATNEKPVITDQLELTTFRNTPITLRLTHLIVSDPDNSYPADFKMEVLAGTNYTFSGNVVTPASGFTGSLSVGVRVNDGTVWSDPFQLIISVVEKDELRIVGQNDIIVREDSSFTITLEHLDVNDPSGKYPSGFTLVIIDGENFSVDGNTIIPLADFNGTLEIGVQVKDASSTSNVFGMIVPVTPVNDPPVFATFSEAPIPYTVGAGDITLAGEVVVNDVDSDNLVFAEVFINQEDFLPGKEILSASSTQNVRSIFDPNTGILVLLGQGSLAEYQELFRSVQYTFNNDTLPAARTKVIHLRMNDGEALSRLYTKTVQMGEGITLDIPNVFSPNEDNANDKWIISRQSLTGQSTATIRVFDKRGTLVYESHSIEEGWDGRYRGEILPSDTYFYTIEIRSNANSLSRKGVVTILR
jgi:gliding motility-associated-like protein